MMDVPMHKQYVARAMASGGLQTRHDTLQSVDQSQWFKDDWNYIVLDCLDATDHLPYGGARWLDWSVKR